MQLGKACHHLAQAAVGVVHVPGRLVELAGSMLDQVRDRLGLPVLQQRFQRIDDIVDPARVPVGAPVVDVAARADGLVDRGAERYRTGAALLRAGRLYEQALAQPVVFQGLLDQQLNQLVPGATAQVLAQPLHRQRGACHVLDPACCRSHSSSTAVKGPRAAEESLWGIDTPLCDAADIGVVIATSAEAFQRRRTATLLAPRAPAISVVAGSHLARPLGSTSRRPFELATDVSIALHLGMAAGQPDHRAVDHRHCWWRGVRIVASWVHGPDPRNARGPASSGYADPRHAATPRGAPIMT